MDRLWLASQGLLAALLAAGTLARAAAQGETCTRATADPSATPTSECTRCHGAGAEDAPGRTGHSHPVDVDYDAAVANRSDLVPRRELPPFVTLAGGRITCLTCHSRTESGTVEARRLGRTLCLACHTLAGSSR